MMRPDIPRVQECLNEAGSGILQLDNGKPRSSLFWLKNAQKFKGLRPSVRNACLLVVDFHNNGAASMFLDRGKTLKNLEKAHTGTGRTCSSTQRRRSLWRRLSEELGRRTASIDLLIRTLPLFIPFVIDLGNHVSSRVTAKHKS